MIVRMRSLEGRPLAVPAGCACRSLRILGLLLASLPGLIRLQSCRFPRSARPTEAWRVSCTISNHGEAKPPLRWFVTRSRVDSMTLLHSLAASPLLRGIVAAVVATVLWKALASSERRTAGIRLLIAILAAVGLAACLGATGSNIVSGREWDFLCFWTYGRALATEQSPYQVAVLRELAEPFAPQEDFKTLSYCLYPPPCVVQFYVLGLMPAGVARVAWFSGQWLAAVGCVALLWRLFDARRSVDGVMATAALFLLFRPTLSTFGFAQTTFLLFACILAYQRSPGPWKRGLWLGLGTVIKPIAAILALDLLLQRRFRSLVACALPVIGGLAVFIALQGPEGLAKYVQRNPLSEEIAGTFFTEDVNQSLLATLLRLRGGLPGARPVLYPPFLIASFVLTLISALVVARQRSGNQNLGLAIWIPLALLLYPGSLGHYSVLLLLPMALLWRDSQEIPGGTAALSWVYAIVFGLVWARVEFGANLVMWLLAVFAITVPRRTETSAVVVSLH